MPLNHRLKTIGWITRYYHNLPIFIILYCLNYHWPFSFSFHTISLAFHSHPPIFPFLITFLTTIPTVCFKISFFIICSYDTQREVIDAFVQLYEFFIRIFSLSVPFISHFMTIVPLLVLSFSSVLRLTVYTVAIIHTRYVCAFSPVTVIFYYQLLENWPPSTSWTIIPATFLTDPSILISHTLHCYHQHTFPSTILRTFSSSLSISYICDKTYNILFCLLDVFYR